MPLPTATTGNKCFYFISTTRYSFEPFLRAALHGFVENHVPSYARMSANNQAREFWVSVYGLGVVHRYEFSLIGLSYIVLDFAS